MKNYHEFGSIWKKVLELVGNFDLDPDRIIDLIVEARLITIDDYHFLSLLRQFNKSSVITVIGNRLKSH